MNLAYFGLRADPFPTTADPRFAFPSASSRSAAAALRRALEARRGIVLLTGEPGSGKTLLLKQLAEQLGDPVRCLYSSQVYLPFEGLRMQLAEHVGVASIDAGGPQDAKALNSRLLEIAKDGGNTVFLLDEARSVDRAALARLPELAPLDPDGRGSLLQLVLGGPPELERQIERPGLESLRERITERVRLGSLDPEEVGPYIAHRLRVAGAPTSELFSTNAIAYVAHYARGNPAAVSSLCENALRLAYRKEQEVVTAELIEAAVAALGWIEAPGPRTASASFPEILEEPAIESAEPRTPETGRAQALARGARGGLAAAALAAGVVVLATHVPPGARMPGLVVAALVALLLGMPLADRRRGRRAARREDGAR